jgi:hypothetical protein
MGVRLWFKVCDQSTHPPLDSLLRWGGVVSTIQVIKQVHGISSQQGQVVSNGLHTVVKSPSTDFIAADP